ncbi:conserved membrane hypothetical protein [uncultured delta proteobacterium]|uniref:DUF1468 domain-containing protein n=1 Tax=uncultured delta proteobacterium TaxID=34034 RepID=A0A212K9R6_9DELT|nr:conserved membrane hypothetical protein [uncultured delta proteobacterium]
MSRLAQESLFAVACVALALLFLFNTGELIPSAALFPRILIGVVIFLSCLMVYQAYRARQAERHADVSDTGRPPFQGKRIAVYFGLCVGYVGSVELLGYFFSTPLFIVLTYAYLRSVRLKTSLAIAVGFSAFIYLLFVRMLHLPVPLGLLENLLEAWQ